MFVHVHENIYALRSSKTWISHPTAFKTYNTIGFYNMYTYQGYFSNAWDVKWCLMCHTMYARTMIFPTPCLPNRLSVCWYFHSCLTLIVEDFRIPFFLNSCYSHSWALFCVFHTEFFDCFCVFEWCMIFTEKFSFKLLSPQSSCRMLTPRVWIAECFIWEAVNVWPFCFRMT